MNQDQEKLVKEAIRKLRSKAIQRRREADQYDKQADKLQGDTDGYSALDDED